MRTHTKTQTHRRKGMPLHDSRCRATAARKLRQPGLPFSFLFFSFFLKLTLLRRECWSVNAAQAYIINISDVLEW